MKQRYILRSIFTILFILSEPAISSECTNWQALHSDWIWCDDFETNLLSNYFEVSGPVVRTAGVGRNGTFGIQSSFAQGSENGGSIKLAFGSTPGFRQAAGVSTTIKYRDIYYRAYLKSQVGWVNPPAGSNSKMMRATVFSSSDWSQAMISHVWTGDNITTLLSDPASCVTGGTVNCVGYNDFSHLQWLGIVTGPTPIFGASNLGNWNCVEHHVKLNDAGLSNGIAEFWVDGVLQARSANLNFVGSYTAYGINAVFFENWINNGSPKDQSRYWDNLVVSTKNIGCNPEATTPPPTKLLAPKNLHVI